MSVAEIEMKLREAYHVSAAPLAISHHYVRTHNLKQEDVIIDLGAGQSGFSESLRERGHRVYSIDWHYANLTKMDEKFDECIRVLLDPENYPIDDYTLGEIMASREIFNKGWAANHSLHIPGRMTQLPVRSNIA